MLKLKTEVIRIVAIICKFFANIIYFFVKILFHTKNKVVMLSRQYNNKSMDFEFIEQEILKRYDEIEIKILCKTIDKGINKKIEYGLYIIKCMYHIATARICIVDGYSIPVSILKHKKSLKIIQIWHSSGAIKKFGYQSLNKKEGRKSKIAKAMNMHKNYSYVMAPSNATAQFYKEAFNVSKDKIFINALPRYDYLLNNNLENEKVKEFYNDYPSYQNKKTILYVPTFRRNSDCTEIIKKVANSVDFEKYNLIVRLHPLEEKKSFNEYNIINKYNIFDLLKISDYIITDYSAVAFEASVLDKPVYFYVYDIEDYEETTGININLFEGMKNCTYKEIEEIIKSIESEKYDYKQLKKFSQKYIKLSKSCSNTSRLVDFIIEDEKKKHI